MSGEGCGLVEQHGGGARSGTRWPASIGQPMCGEKLTCVHDPGRCERLDGRSRSNSKRDCELNSRVIRDTQVDRRGEGKKRFCCVTTRRRNLRVLNGLGRRPRLSAALSFRPGALGIDAIILTTFGLAPRRLPTEDLPLTFRILAVALVPAPGFVLAAAAFAQADAPARSARSG